MTTPANLTYTQIETRVMNALRIPVANTTEQTKVAAVINEVYRDICVKQDWWWLEKYAVINTGPKITGSINLTVNSTSIVFSSEPQQYSGTSQVIKNFALYIPGQANDWGAIYRVLTSALVTSTNALTAQLDAKYTDVTSTAASYRLYQDTYNLPADVGKLLRVSRFGETVPIELVGPNEMSRIKLVDKSEGKPEVVSINDFFTTGDPTTPRQLRVHPYPDKAYRLEIWYKQQLNTELASSTQPFIPDEYRQLLIYGALARCYPIFLNDMDRGGHFTQLFNDLLLLMTAAQREYARDNGRMDPVMTDYRRTRPRPRTAFTLGNWFDRLPYQP